MIDARFDGLIAALGQARTRRELALALLATGAAAMASRGTARAHHGGGNACLGFKERCQRKAACCSGMCRGRKGSKRKCRCSPEGEHCNQSSDCCETAEGLLCVAGFCVRRRDRA